MVNFPLSFRWFWPAAVLITGTAVLADRPVTVFAAASLGDVLAAAADSSRAPVRLSLGGSGAIARQIVQGAPADAIILADPEWLFWVEKQDITLLNSGIAPFGNRLVVIGPNGAEPLTSDTQIPEKLSRQDRLAMGEHRAVPAGRYARQWLETRSLWDSVAPHLAEVENVRAAFALVARNEAPLAIVYASDLAAAPKQAQLVWDIPAEHQPDIRYAIGALTPDGVSYLETLTAPATLEVFSTFGFTLREAR